MGSKRICREFRLCPSEAVLNLSPKAHTKTDTSSQEKLFGEIQNSFSVWEECFSGLFESGFAFCLGKMKEVTGIEYYLWGAGFLLSLTLSMVLLAKAVQTLPIGTAYPVWTGIGAVGTVLLGIVFFHEPVSFLRLFFVTTLIASIVGLKMV